MRSMPRTAWLAAFESPPHRYPPFGLLAVGKALSELGLSVKVLHTDEADPLELVAAVIDAEISWVGMSVTAGPTFEASVKAGRALRAAGVTVVWGGAMPTVAPEICAGFGACDLMVQGTAENDLSRLFISSSPHEAPRIVRCVKTDTNDGSCPIYPDPRLLSDPSAYLTPRPPFKAVACLPLSRGCRRRCAFCAAPSVSGGRFRYETADILHAAAFWTEELGADALEYADDELMDGGFDVRGLVERIGLPFYAQVHARTVTSEAASWLRSAGCQMVKMGAESGSDRTLRTIRKGLCSMDLIRAAEHLLDNAIPSMLTFIIGFPEETPADLMATVDLAYRLAGLDPRMLIRFCHFTPYPGTELWSKSIELGFVPPKDEKGWAALDIARPVVPWLDGRMACSLVNRLNEELFFRRVNYLSRTTGKSQDREETSKAAPDAAQIF